MRAIVGFVVVVIVVACQQAPKATPPVPFASSPSAALAPTPIEALDRLDQRKPLPLLPMMANHQKQNMREHLEVIQEVVTAAASRDFAKVAGAANRIGYSEAMGQMCEHMGAGAPGFTEQALAFHRTADGITAAAKREDQGAVLTALGQTLAACTACHATYKQKLVTDLP